MKDLENANCGNLETLKNLGDTKSNDYTTEQLLDEELKNIDGESNKEVRERMKEFFWGVLEQYSGKRIVVVSHGAAIKFLIQEWCRYNHEEKAFYRNGALVCLSKLESPSALKLVFENKELISIEKLL